MTIINQFRLFLPFPAKVLWPNGRTKSHRYKSSEVRQHRQWARMATLEAVGRDFEHDGGPIQLTYIVTPKTAHAIDKDNVIAAMKSYQDGISEALGVNDSHFSEPVIRFASPKKPGMVEVRL